MNKVVGESNLLHKFELKKRLVRIFSKIEFYKCIGYILLEFAYKKKGCMIWVKTSQIWCWEDSDSNIPRCFWENRFNKSMLLYIFIFTGLFSINLCYLTLLHWFIEIVSEDLYLSRLQVCGVSLGRFKEIKELWPCYFISKSVKCTDTLYIVQGSLIVLTSHAVIFPLG